MTSVISGSDTKKFTEADEVVDHLLSIVLKNRRERLGMELESFVFDENENPITRQNGQALFRNLAIEFEKEYGKNNLTVTTEKANPVGRVYITKLDIKNLGAVTIEPGQQFELVTLPHSNPTDVLTDLQKLQNVLKDVVDKMGHKVEFKGYSEKSADLTEGGVRPRDLQWAEYYDSFPSSQRAILRRGQFGTASTQITIDSGSNKFHEYWSALLLIEPIVSLKLNQSTDRLKTIKSGYGSIIPDQVEPITGAWQAKSPRKTVEHIVGRLMDLTVPFLPNRSGVLEPLPHNMEGRPPTVRELMAEGLLTERALNNVGGFLYSNPAFRNLTKGLIEVRSLDSTDNPEKQRIALNTVATLVYKDDVRIKMLDDYKWLSETDIAFLQRGMANGNRQSVLNAYIGTNGHRRTVREIFNDIMARAEQFNPTANFHAASDSVTDHRDNKSSEAHRNDPSTNGSATHAQPH